jgi:GT2 family glycosyltransferase
VIRIGFTQALWTLAERLPGVRQSRVGGVLAARPGWHVLRVVGAPEAVRAIAAVRIGARQGVPLRLPLRPSLPSMRVLRIDDAGPLACDGLLQSAALVRVPGALARYLLRRHLLRRHPNYFGLNQRALRHQPFAPQWADYNDLFDRPSAARLSYQQWRSRRERELPHDAQRAEVAAWPAPPRLLVVAVAAPHAERELAATKQSLRDQGYLHWDWLAVGSIPDAAACAAALAHCDAVAFLEAGDRLRTDALFKLAQALRGPAAPQLVYSDHDHLDAFGRRSEPFFKPGPSPDLLYAQNVLSPMLLLRSDAVAAAGGLQVAWSAGAAGAHTLAWVLALHVLRRSPDARMARVAEVLCHRGTAPDAEGSHDDAVALAALNAHLAAATRDGIAPRAEAVAPGLRRIRWPLPEPAPLVSIIIPTRNAVGLLGQCIASIERLTQYRPYELLVVDNQSDEPDALDYFAELECSGRVRVLRYDAPFNYSAINNHAVREARGSVLALVNNDVEAVAPDWLGEMVALALRPGIGCVGAKLDFPDGTIQHAGVVLGIGGVAGHAHKYLPGDAPGYFGRLRVVHEVAAVTGAVMVLRKAVFDELGGFDEQGLTIAYNDVDLCLRALRAGYRNLWTPHAHLIHHESKTRGLEDTPAKRARWETERAVMRERWAHWLDDDPYYSPHLSRTHEDYSMRAPAPPPR